MHIQKITKPPKDGYFIIQQKGRNLRVTPFTMWISLSLKDLFYLVYNDFKNF